MAQRIYSLEQYLGLVYSPKEKGQEYDEAEHIEQEYGLIPGLKKRLKVLEPKDKVGR